MSSSAVEKLWLTVPEEALPSNKVDLGKQISRPYQNGKVGSFQDKEEECSTILPQYAIFLSAIIWARHT